MTPHAMATAALLIAGIYAGDPALAAPATSDELRPGPGAAAVDATTPSLATGHATPGAIVPPQSRTVELLLQLQDQPGRARETDGRRPAPDPLRTGVAAPAPRPAAPESPATVNPLLEMKTSLFGPGSEGSSKSEARLADVERDVERMAAPGRTTAPGVRSGESGSSLLMHPVIRFIREHRTLTISVSIGVLAAVWLTANYRSRSYRR